MTKTCLLRTLACLAPAAIAAELHAQELITNGNFEGATLAPWEVSAPAGTTIIPTSENSPYLTRYPAGTASVRLEDDDVEFETPFFRQSFAGRGAIQFSFDFKATAATAGSSWYVIWRGENDTTAFFFSIGGNDGASIVLNQETIATLEPDMWYHIEGNANAPAQTLTGSVLNSRGQRTSFSGSFPFGVQQVINGVTITDGDQGVNQPILFDNFSALPGALVVPRLQIARGPGDQVTVSWNVAGYTLQATSAIGPGAQWTSIPTPTQVFTTGTEAPTQFFRLVQN